MEYATINKQIKSLPLKALPFWLPLLNEVFPSWAAHFQPSLFQESHLARCPSLTSAEKAVLLIFSTGFLICTDFEEKVIKRSASETQIHKSTHKFGAKATPLGEGCRRMSSGSRDNGQDILWNRHLEMEMGLKLRTDCHTQGRESLHLTAPQVLGCYGLWDSMRESLQRTALGA